MHFVAFKALLRMRLGVSPLAAPQRNTSEPRSHHIEYPAGTELKATTKMPKTTPTTISQPGKTNILMMPGLLLSKLTLRGLMAHLRGATGCVIVPKLGLQIMAGRWISARGYDGRTPDLNISLITKKNADANKEGNVLCWLFHYNYDSQVWLQKPLKNVLEKTTEMVAAWIDRDHECPYCQSLRANGKEALCVTFTKQPARKGYRMVVRPPKAPSA